MTSSFVIGGTSTVLVLLVGFMFLNEPFTWRKLFAVALIRRAHCCSNGRTHSRAKTRHYSRAG